MSGARRTDPDTSHAAFKSINTSRLEAEVLEVIKRFGEKGAIADEIEARMPHLRNNTVTPRFMPLLSHGLIYDTGLRRIGGAKRMQRVVAATPPDQVKNRMIEYALAAIARDEKVEFIVRR